MATDEDFEAWYRAAHPRLTRAMVAITGSTDLADEIVDEAAARCVLRWRRPPPLEDPTAWTYRVAVNLARRRAGRAASERKALAYLDAPEAASLSEPAIELWREVAALPHRQRVAVVLRYLGGLTQPQVAEAMGISTGTAAATLHAARRRLVARLDPEGHESHVP